jgi:hypothetical protein
MSSFLKRLFSNYFLVIFPLVCVFIYSLYNPSDTDLGWHLKYGEYFFSHLKPLKENIFSIEMPDYRWINSSWLTDVLSYSIYKLARFSGLTIAAAFIVVLIYFFSFAKTESSFFSKSLIYPIFLLLLTPLISVSFRGHLLSLLGVAIALYIYRVYPKNYKVFYILPLLFFLWSNLHGEFILGLYIGLVFLFLEISRKIQISSFKKIKQSLQEIFVPLIFFVFSVASTLINPYGFEIYTETFKHLNDPMQKYIIEWLPFDFQSVLFLSLFVMTIAFIISFIFIVKDKKTDFYPNLIVTFTFLFMSYFVRRYAWVAYISSIPTMTYLTEKLKPKSVYNQTKIGIFIFLAFYIYTLTTYPKRLLFHFNWTRYCREYANCSPESAEFIIKNKLNKKNILTFYNWGGWLIFNYPEIKPTIDGRMHLWKDQNNYSAFARYYAFEQGWSDINQSEYEIVYFPLNKPLVDMLIRNDNYKNWKEIFRDNYSTIFVRI